MITEAQQEEKLNIRRLAILIGYNPYDSVFKQEESEQNKEKAQ